MLGVPDATLEETLVACKVAEKGVTAAGIRAYCAVELSADRRSDGVLSAGNPAVVKSSRPRAGAFADRNEE